MPTGLSKVQIAHLQRVCFRFAEPAPERAGRSVCRTRPLARCPAWETDGHKRRRTAHGGEPRFGQKTASHPPSVRRRDRFREEKPDMRVISRTGSFHCGSEAIFITALAECADICLPACLVEICRQQICCVILQHGINSDHITAQRVAPQ